jgi:hypothetical protein
MELFVLYYFLGIAAILLAVCLGLTIVVYTKNSPERLREENERIKEAHRHYEAMHLWTTTTYPEAE